MIGEVGRWEDPTRRGVDVLLAAAGLIGMSPVFVGCAVAVKLCDGGPIFFRQERVGRGGKRFRIRKFRTMQSDGASGRLISTGDDARITKVGRVLRKTKLDELPQLLDVLEGTMSLVGPRPEVPCYVVRWPPADRDVILSVRPGITDPTSVWLRHESDILTAQEDPEDYYVDVLLPTKAALARKYVESRRLHTDMMTIVHTLRAVVRS